MELRFSDAGLLNVILSPIRGRPGRTRSCRPVSTEAGADFCRSQNQLQHGCSIERSRSSGRQLSVGNMPGDSWDAFLQDPSKKGTSNISEIKFHVVDTNGRPPAPIYNLMRRPSITNSWDVLYGINHGISIRSDGQMDLSEKMNLRINNSK
jgi:hypothetical protein